MTMPYMRTLLLLVVAFDGLVATSKASHSGANIDRTYFQRKVAGIQEGLRWVTTPFIAPQTKREARTVQISLVGFGRTGTTSLEAALKVLGYVPLQDDLIYEVSDIFGMADRDEITFDEWAKLLGRRGFDDVYWYGDRYLENG